MGEKGELEFDSRSSFLGGGLVLYGRSCGKGLSVWEGGAGGGVWNCIPVMPDIAEGGREGGTSTRRRGLKRGRGISDPNGP